MGDSPTSAIGTPDQIREHLRALQAAGVDQVLLMHQAGRLDHDANCRSLELFATEAMPEFVEGEDEREAAKADRLAPGDRGGRPARCPPMPAEIPVVERTVASATSRPPRTVPSRRRHVRHARRSGRRRTRSAEPRSAQRSSADVGDAVQPDHDEAGEADTVPEAEPVVGGVEDRDDDPDDGGEQHDDPAGAHARMMAVRPVDAVGS